LKLKLKIDNICQVNTWCPQNICICSFYFVCRVVVVVSKHPGCQ